MHVAFARCLMKWADEADFTQSRMAAVGVGMTSDARRLA